jgi:hypothetical protein
MYAMFRREIIVYDDMLTKKTIDVDIVLKARLGVKGKVNNIELGNSK